MTISIAIGSKRVRSTLQALERGLGAGVAVSALNRAATSTRKRASDYVREDLAIKAASAKKRIDLKRANRFDRTAVLSTRKGQLTSGSYPTTRRAKGYAVKVYPNRQPQHFPSSFKIPNRVPVFRREGRARYPIRPLWFPGPHASFRRRAPEIVRYANERIGIEYKRAVQAVLSRRPRG